MSWRIKRHRWKQKNKRTTWRGDAAERRTSSTCETNQVEKWPVWLFLLTVRERKHPINWKQDWTATGQSHRGFWHQPEFDLYLHPSMGPVHLVSVNDPTLPSRNKGEALWWTWGDGEKQLYLLGDLNARPTDHNSWDATKPIHKVSRRHPSSRHWHQLDLITPAAALRGKHAVRPATDRLWTGVKNTTGHPYQQQQNNPDTTQSRSLGRSS